MGCVPGTLIKLEFTAPSGDPIAFNVEGYLLGLRRSEAQLLVVELIDTTANG
jgi:ferrous iron transport protein A